MLGSSLMSIRSSWPEVLSSKEVQRFPFEVQRGDDGNSAAAQSNSFPIHEKELS
jgi:hypothetical protein